MSPIPNIEKWLPVELHRAERRLDSRRPWRRSLLLWRLRSSCLLHFLFLSTHKWVKGEMSWHKFVWSFCSTFAHQNNYKEDLCNAEPWIKMFCTLPSTDKMHELPCGLSLFLPALLLLLQRITAPVMTGELKQEHGVCGEGLGQFGSHTSRSKRSTNLYFLCCLNQTSFI